MILDFSKYKRVFAFGCSFTNYTWPTWANIIHSEMPDAEFYNLAIAGSGNLAIGIRISEANLKFQFNAQDLILIMFTTFTREDRWVNGDWIANGNIYNQHVYSPEWVSKFADPLGYLIRDLALVSLIKDRVNALPADSLMLIADSRISNQESETSTERIELLNTIKQLYTPLMESFPLSLYDCVTKNSIWEIGHSFYVKHPVTGRKELFKDTHPNPSSYLNYLKKMGLNLTDKAEEYAFKSNELLKTVDDQPSILALFPEIVNNLKFSKKHMF